MSSFLNVINGLSDVSLCSISFLPPDEADAKGVAVSSR